MIASFATAFVGFVAGVLTMKCLTPPRLSPDLIPLADLLREHATYEGNHTND